MSPRLFAPAGAPFLKHNVIDMARQLEIEAGVPVAAPVDGDGEVFSAVLSAERPQPGARHGQVGNPAGVQADRLNPPRSG
jgi:hypothetical protein